MKSTLKSLIQGFLSVLGYRLTRLPNQAQIKQANEEEMLKKLWWKNTGFKTIIDIGSHVGQFVYFALEISPNANIYSFEPLKDCYEELKMKFANFSNFQALNMALGNTTGQVEIHRSEFSPSSSLLPMAELHKVAFPYTKNEIIEIVDIAKLDDIAVLLKVEKPLLVKLDVQGFENEVIAGGINTICQADVLIIELSLERLYEGQKLFHDLYEKLVNLGFKYRGNFDQIINPNNGKILQIDAIFIRE